MSASAEGGDKVNAMTASLRPYEVADAQALAQLYFESVQTLGPRGYSAEQVHAWSPAPADAETVHARAGDGRLTLVAVDVDGAVVGYGDLEADGHLDHLYVHPSAAGQGLGGRLIAALLAEASARGIDRVFVEASEIARPAFLRHGFTVSHRRDFEVRGVAIHNYAMERVVDDRS